MKFKPLNELIRKMAEIATAETQKKDQRRQSVFKAKTEVVVEEPEVEREYMNCNHLLSISNSVHACNLLFIELLAHGEEK